MCTILCIYTNSTAQQYVTDTTPVKDRPLLNFSGYLENYYVYDVNKPTGTKRQPFLFNHNRHHSFQLNLGYLKINIEQKNYRMNFGLQAGTYVEDNYSAEPGPLKFIYESNVGLSLLKNQKLWIDAGIFPSYIGFESAVSFDNFTMTRSLLAENSPYYISGIKLSYKPNQQWEFNTILCNGWQRIQKVDGNSLLSLGTQIKLTTSDNTIFNWSSFAGTDDPDSTRRWRFFNNFYTLFSLSEKLNFITGFDIGIQQTQKQSRLFQTWYSPVIIARYCFSQHWKSALRIEFFQDKNKVIIQYDAMDGFQTSGSSINLDFTPVPHFLARLEGRYLYNPQSIFIKNASFSQNNFTLGVSFTYKFQHSLLY